MRLLAITGLLVAIIVLIPAIGVLVVLGILAWIRWTWERS